MKKELSKIKNHLLSLEENPFQGDIISIIGKVVLKEIRFNTFRFYCIHSKELLIIKEKDKLINEIITFIEYSKKNNQQRVIDKLKEILSSLQADSS